MQRINLPIRAQGDPSLETDSYLSQSGYWTEGLAYCINEDQAEKLRADANSLLEHFDMAMSYIVGNKEVLDKFIFTGDETEDVKIRRLIRASWQDATSRQYVMDRWDIAWDGVNPFKVLERNFGHLGLVVGTGPVQEDYVHWLSQQDGYSDVRTFGSLQKNIVQAFREVAEECGIISGSHLAIAGWVNQMGSDPGMIQAARVLNHWVRRAGFIPDFIEAHDASFNDGMTFLHRHMTAEKRIHMDAPHGFSLNDVVQYFTPSAPAIYNFPFSDPYCRSVSQFSTEEVPTPYQITKSLQPFWTYLGAHKGLLAVMYELFPEHPNLLPTYWGSEGLQNERRIVKHVLGMQGLGSTIWNAAGEKAVERPDTRGALLDCQHPLTHVTQAYCDAVVEPTGGFKVLNLFTANRVPAGLGVRSAPNAFVGGDDTQTRFSGVIIRPVRSTQHTPAGVL